MKITIDQSSLAEGLNKIQSAISSRPTIPILSNVHLVALDNSLVLTATDLDISVTTTIACSVEREGSTTLPAKKLTQIIRQLPSFPVTIDTDMSHISSISCQHSFFKIQGISDLEFPIDNELDNPRVFTLSNHKLRKMLDNISYAVSLDDTRVVLMGILLSVREGTLTSVATDGRRLALMETSLDTDENLDGDTILPIKMVNELQKLLSSEGEVKVSLSESRAAFTTNHTVMRTKLIEGNYPNYRQVIPSGFTEMIEIPREELSKAISRVSLILSDSGASVKLAMTSKSVLVSAVSNTDESSEPIAVNYIGTPLTISLNPAYIQEPLKRLECNNITFKFNDKVSPIGVFGDEGYLYVIMPMRN